MRNGSLSISHGSYFLRVYVNGKQRRINLGRIERFRSKKAVDDAAREALISIRRSDPSGKLTLAEYTKLIYLPIVKTRVRHSTYEGYRQIYRTHIQPRPEAKLALWEYSTHEVQRLLNAVAEEKSLTTTTLKHVKALLSGIFRMAIIAKERSGSNPVHEAILPTYSARQPGDTVAYDLETIRAVLPRVSLPVRAALAIAFYSGLRRSEIQGLHWSDYDDQSITVRRSVFHGRESAPKSKASRSTVPVIPALKVILDEYKDEHSGPLFPTQLDDLTRRPLRHAFAEVGSRWVGFHAARRGLASNLFALGVEPGVVQKILRHSSLAVTMTHYVKVGDRQKEAAMEQFSRSLDSRREQDADGA
jgi:integrase